MRNGFVVPYATEREFAELARLGESAGWDGIFGWEALYGVHAWTQLGAAAMVTERIRLGTLLTPASRHRPWDLASMVGSFELRWGEVMAGATLIALPLFLMFTLLSRYFIQGLAAGATKG